MHWRAGLLAIIIIIIIHGAAAAVAADTSSIAAWIRHCDHPVCRFALRLDPGLLLVSGNSQWPPEIQSLVSDAEERYEAFYKNMDADTARRSLALIETRIWNARGQSFLRCAHPLAHAQRIQDNITCVCSHPHRCEHEPTSNSAGQQRVGVQDDTSAVANVFMIFAGILVGLLAILVVCVGLRQVPRPLSVALLNDIGQSNG